ncbi:MAG: lactate utilization protein [Desulfovibrio sp.]|jgi:hypothetical protein|nr:lactate utilization protein [Mailhella sp.]
MDFTRIRKVLEGLGYSVSCFESSRDACAYLDGKVDGTTVGFGGSVTLEQMGLFERLAAHNDVAWHQKVPKGTDTRPIRLKENAARVYFSSVNGLAETGEVINIDGTGNRVAATWYGREKLYLVAGRNKIAPDFESALFRARNVAAPLNAKRLGVKTPCAEKGDRCYDCKSPARICRGLSVFWRCPSGSDIEIVLINEDLGY